MKLKSKASHFSPIPADVQVHPLLVEQVLQATRCRDDHVHTLADDLRLQLAVHASDAQQHAQLWVAILL